MTTSTNPESRSSKRGNRFLRISALILGGLIVVLCALLVLGTHLPDIPYLGPVGTFLVPQYTPWFVLLPLIGGALTLWAWRAGRRGRAALTLTVVAALTALGGAVVFGRMASTARASGADINLLSTFSVSALTDEGTPDDTVAFTTYEGQPLNLAIYRPSERADGGSAPVLVYVHGGGWAIGTRLDHSADMRWFADQGYLVISVDYTLSTAQRNLWNVTQGQVGCAMAWVNKNASQYGGDASRFFMTGDSAGGNLVINTSYMANSGTLESSCGVLPRVDAVSTLYPGVDVSGIHNYDDEVMGGLGRIFARQYTGGTPQQYPERYRAVQSATHISPSAPLTLIIVGENDHIVPPEITYVFAEEAQAAGVEVQLVRMPYADHVFDGVISNIGDQTYRQLTQQFLAEHDPQL